MFWISIDAQKEEISLHIVVIVEKFREIKEMGLGKKGTIGRFDDFLRCNFL